MLNHHCNLTRPNSKRITGNGTLMLELTITSSSRCPSLRFSTHFFFTTINPIWVGDLRPGEFLIFFEDYGRYSPFLFLRMLSVRQKIAHADWACAKKLPTEAECALKKMSKQGINLRTLSLRLQFAYACWACARKLPTQAEPAQKKLPTQAEHALKNCLLRLSMR
jgi:hypothetical protein